MRLHSPARKIFNGIQRAVDKRRKRRRSSTLSLAGLHDNVEIVTDTFGVPHIYADNSDDLFFAQGFVTARDRLFQMDYSRHAAQGRLCELLGRKSIPWRDLTVHLKERSTFDVDVMLRTFGLRRSAEASLPLHSPESRAILQAYAAGINAYIAMRRGTLEHTLLGIRPRLWEEVDSLSLLKAMGFELNFAWRAILLGALLNQAKVPETIARKLWPHFPHDGATIVDSDALSRMASDLALTRQAADMALGFGNAAAVGSNCFAVAASHSANGHALLANDTHLTMVAPTPWHEVHLHGGGFDLHGFTLAGLPGIGIGRTPHHAWGITAGLVHDLDLFVEKLNPDDPNEYLTVDGWKPLGGRQETFVIRGEATVQRTISETYHGPLLETVATNAPVGHKLALCWTGMQPGRELDALLQSWTATSLEQMRDIVRFHTCPTFNITYAGADGRVAYLLAGTLPKRRKATPLRPLEGWTGEWDWQGTVPHQENPCDLHASQGFTVTANNRPAPWEYPHELGQLFEPADRFDRISERLKQLGKSITLEDLKAIQLDTHSAWGSQVRDMLLAQVGGVARLVTGADPLQLTASRLFAEWDGNAHRQSPAAALVYMTAYKTGREVVRLLAGEDAAFAFLEMNSFIGQPLLELPALRDALMAHGIDLAAAIQRAFVETVDECLSAMGSDVSQWEWGRIHTLTCRHRFFASAAGSFFNIGPEPADGGPDTVNRGDFSANNGFRYRVGAAMRMLVDAADGDTAQTIIPGGQSGDRLSMHYDDQYRLFLAGQYKRAAHSRDQVEQAWHEWLVPGLE